MFIQYFELLTYIIYIFKIKICFFIDYVETLKEKATELCKKHPSLMEATRLVAAPAEAQTPAFLSSGAKKMAKLEVVSKHKARFAKIQRRDNIKKFKPVISTGAKKTK